MHERFYKKRLTKLQEAFRLGKASHAYLFLGEVNQKNEEAIILLAQTLLCQSAEQRPCGSCRSCFLLASKSHPDFREIEPDGSSIKLEQIREICYDTSLNPYLSPNKVYFFKKFDSLTEVAANAFLKTLEEPPPAVYFLAIAENEGGILPTILSRMQRVNFGSYSQDKVLSYKEEDLLEGKDLFTLFKQAETLSGKNRTQVGEYLREIQDYYRGLLVSEVFKGHQVNKRLVHVIAAVQKAREYAAANINLRLLLEDLYLQIYEELGSHQH